MMKRAGGQLTSRQASKDRLLARVFAAGTSKFLGKSLHLHQSQKPLVRGQAEVLPEERAIDVFLVSLDDAIDGSHESDVSL